MSENALFDVPPTPPAGSAADGQTAGKLLKEARLKAGVHLAVLSVNLKVPVRQLEALEADRYLTQESPVFVRGLASSVCRHLRMDPTPVLALLPQSDNFSENPVLTRQTGLAPGELTVLRSPSVRPPVPIFLAVLGMLALIAALLWLPSPATWGWLNTVTDYWAKPSPEVTTAPPVVEVASVPATPDAAQMGATTLVPTESVSPLAKEATESTEVKPAPSAAPPDGRKLPTSTGHASVSEWVFSASAESWLEVRDGQNQVIWSGILKPGESARFQAPLPVSVVVGRADALQVSFKGQAFDLKPHSKSNVARFEVKP